MDCGHASGLCQSGQGDQRRGRVAGPVGDFGDGLGVGGEAEDGLEGVRVGTAGRPAGAVRQRQDGQFARERGGVEHRCFRCDFGPVLT
ncbi:hypothetical protein SDC9_204183 [bioreactor metagenome]|uniref:Uncharacterized protein n=1 Tax=bioreactor metagenome TaxID=1076179 RepID=A0A645JAE9_9ZZZZ